jgi:shikimate kinase
MSLYPGRNLVLIGLMGAGKTTVGQTISKRLGRPFIDTDEMIEAEEGKTVAEIFHDEGERRFRDLEASAVRAVSATRGQVIAVGGGAVLQRSNVTALRSTGDLVLLDAAPEVLAERVEVENEVRPLLTGTEDLAARLAELRRTRDADYAIAAHHTIDTEGMQPAEIAAAILDWAAHRPGLLTREEREL